MHRQSLSQLSTALQKKHISSVELTQHFIDRINRYDQDLNSFITVTEDQAHSQAQAADKSLAQGNASALTGIPIAHKDIFCTNGIRTSCGSRMLDNFIAPYDATVVEKLEDSGVVMLGKTNMDEFAMGSSNETSYYGPVSNPWANEHVPGGSSGGSAAAVAAGLAVAATGTDTGGSIRQPAALCGITGLKPTYGRVSRYGMIAFASSLDQGGPMARDARDAAMLLNAMTGFDPRDSTSADQAGEDYTAALEDQLQGLKIGLPKQYFSAELDGEVAAVIDTSIKTLEKLGATFVDIELRNTHLSIPAYYVIAPAECSSNLSRFDGVRFGYRCDKPEDLLDLYCRSRAEGFGREVKRRIMIGTYALSAGYYDAYYLKAQQIRRLIQQDFNSAFDQVDVILGPTTPDVAFKKNERTGDPVSMYLSDVYTVSVNLAGLPAMSIPAGFKNGLPVGLQLIGNYFRESQLLNIAHRFQQETDHHQQHPEACT
ncbi:MAG: Asp-tRNA(Asn)/Glu-tRNA(Gln) amidotransferase subunit GatA [Thiotrichales bacterium]|nr:Asp-tRNA(Asn)/Glu-tRNA(Gln) amidotransferase subunit GatA [Thiotrichales bacterium]